ncbi:MerR family transcriptional regulator [Nocardia wallacei]|uniref:MerR family transcriptional regulator n=1 Tax=Nocardia wallacei TaxID=480035 RepID=UPI002458685D|nr:MerR family transcriptional regulator [Nocardia wallacei]
MGKLSISELRARTGLASSALRFYERKGLLRSSGRTGGQRCYDADAVERIAFIDLLKSAGFTLSEIAVFVAPAAESRNDWRALSSAKLRELDEQLAQIRQAQHVLRHLLDCRHDRLDHCPEHHRILRAHAETLAAGQTTRSREGR